MPCFVPQCHSRRMYKRRLRNREIKEYPRLFRIPADELKRWESAISRQDRKLTLNDRVCSVHFHEDDIVKYFETKLPNGEIDRIPRTKWMVRPGAIPSIFPNGPEQEMVTREQSKRRENVVLKARRSHSEPKVEKVQNDTTLHEKDPLGDEYLCSASDEGPSCLEGFTFQKFVDEFSNITLPSAQWAKSILPTGAAFLEWTPEMKNNKKIIIHNNLKVEVVLKDTVVAVRGYETVHSTTQMLKLLEIVDGMVLCSSEPQSRIILKCHGFVHKRGTLCTPCKIQRNIRSEE